MTQDCQPRKHFCGVHLPDLPYGLDREFTYEIPEAFLGQIYPGRFVGVPFGRGDRLSVALVTSADVSAPEAEEWKELRIKQLAALCPENISLDAEMLRVMNWLCSQTLCTVGDAVHAMIPAAAFSRLGEYYSPAENCGALPRDPVCGELYRYIASRGSTALSTLKGRFGSDCAEPLKKLVKCGAVIRRMELQQTERKKKKSYALLIDGNRVKEIIDGAPVKTGAGLRKISSEGQLTVLASLADSGRPMLEEELRSLPGVTPANLDSLVEKGLISLKEDEVDRDELLLESRNYVKTGKPEPIDLKDEQIDAYKTLHGLAFGGKAAAALLEGVTGSGKTCVMLRIIDDVLESGRGVILLLPEISLTPQSLSIFCSRYGNRVAVMHSGLSAGERNDAYCRIKSGVADLVIGTRSAVFAPVKNPGLIIIDEEQEHTYKSDSTPRYHARDIARVRCAENGGLMLLASATPSLESRKKAEDGYYTLIRMTKRYGNSVLPQVTVADMRLEAAAGNVTPIGTLLAGKLKETFARGEQSVLFLNRRGYNNYFSCASCGEAIKCENCSVSMTFHTRKGSYSEGELRCHWCGRRIPVPKKCPSCGSEHLLHMGYGTQRVEQELSMLLPGARILRMDTDSTAGKDAYDSMLGAFRRHEADVLLGTQMVTKGHDFPDVTLVGVLLADASLYYDDYRASERTFALLTQVIGRAGRRDRAGEAVIQTNNPKHEIIELAKRQDYEAMYAREIKLRRSLCFPPYCDIALLTVTGADERAVVTSAAKLQGELAASLEGDTTGKLKAVVFGPFEAPVYRVEGKYRMRIIVKCGLNREMRRLFATMLCSFREGTADKDAPSLTVDFNPTNL